MSCDGGHGSPSKAQEDRAVDLIGLGRGGCHAMDYVLHDADLIYNGASMQNNINDSREI